MSSVESPRPWLFAKLCKDMTKDLRAYSQVFSDVDGAEIVKNPHVTLFHELLDMAGDAAVIERITNAQAPAEYVMGKLRLFKKSDRWAVVVVVHSRQMVELRRNLSQEVQHAISSHGFNPHVTLAYVPPFTAESLDGQSIELTGRECVIDELVIEHGRNRDVLTLLGSGVSALPLDDGPFTKSVTWDESEHPRDEDGQFDEKPTAAVADGYNVQVGYAGMSNAFKVDTDGGSYAHGYLSGSSAPNEPNEDTLAELFFIEVPKGERGKGKGKKLARRAIDLMQENGATHVMLHPLNDAARGMNESLVRDGVIELVESYEKGAEKYKITAGEKAGAVDHTDTPEFKAWFGDSKVVDTDGRPTENSPSSIEIDKDGEPLIVWHGTTADFDVFDNPHGGWNMFSDSREYSEHFGPDRGGKLMQLYLRSENPLDLRKLPRRRGDARNELLDALKYDDNGRTPISDSDLIWLENNLPYEKDLFAVINSADTDQLTEILQQAGYDGIVFPDYRLKVVDNKWDDVKATTWVVFDSNQVKSATDNAGTFDPDDGNIRKSVAIERRTLADFNESLHPRDQLGRFDFKPESQIHTPEFREWFSDSHIVDEDGKPLVVYHGTNAEEFTVFQSHGKDYVYSVNGDDVRELNSWDFDGDESRHPDGYHYGALSDVMSFDGDANAAYEMRKKEHEKYGGDPDGSRHVRDLKRLQDVTLERRIENVPTGDGFYFTPDEAYSFISKSKRNYPVYLSLQNPKYVDSAVIESAGRDFRVEEYVAEGHDGVIFAPYPEDLERRGWSGSTQIVVFRSSQIKSAIGNEGTFDSSNPDIRKAFDRLVTKAVAFDESKHKRDGDGRFTFTNGVYGQPTNDKWLDQVEAFNTSGDHYQTAMFMDDHPPSSISPEVLRSLRTLEALGKQPGIEQIAMLAGLQLPDIHEATERAEVKSRELLENASVGIRITSSDFESMVKDGKFKTQIETGDSEGDYDPEARQQVESDLFETPRDQVEDRPVYGYLFEDIHHPRYRHEDKGSWLKTVANYGDITVVMKPEVRDRTSFTNGDSLGEYDSEHRLKRSTMHDEDPDERQFAPALVGGDGNKRVGFNWQAYGSKILGTDSIDDVPSMFHTVEAQVHGGVTVDDIDSVVVHFNQRAFADLPFVAFERLSDNGVKVQLSLESGARDIYSAESGGSTNFPEDWKEWLEENTSIELVGFVKRKPVRRRGARPRAVVTKSVTWDEEKHRRDEGGRFDFKPELEASLNPEQIENLYMSGGVMFDGQDGIGATGMNGNLNHMGYAVEMTPQQFLDLNTVRTYDDGIDFFKEKIDAGVPLGPPLLLTRYNAESGQMEVVSHEGRGRMKAIMEANNNAPVFVHVFPTLKGGGELRPNHWAGGDADLTEALAMSEIVPDEDRKTPGKAFKPTRAIRAGAVVDSGSGGQTDTPEFKAWFGDSEIVDEDGKPMVMYHGTARDFTEFRTDRPSDGVNRRNLISLTTDPEFANMYAGRTNGSDYAATGVVMPLFVSAQNVADFRKPEHIELYREHNRAAQEHWLRTKANREAWDVQTEEKLLARAIVEADKFTEYAREGHWAQWENPEFLREHGFDAAWVRESENHSMHETVNLSVVSASQIKSAIGNQGTFDPDDDDIRKSFDQLFTKNVVWDESKVRRDEDGQFDFKPDADLVVPDISVEMIGSIKGQQDFEASVRVDGQVVGVFTYALYSDHTRGEWGEVIRPQMVEVQPEHRRKGYATAMYAAAMEQHPTAWLDEAMMTPDGAKFRAALPVRLRERVRPEPLPEVTVDLSDEWNRVSDARRGGESWAYEEGDLLQDYEDSVDRWNRMTPHDRRPEDMPSEVYVATRLGVFAKGVRLPFDESKVRRDEDGQFDFKAEAEKALIERIRNRHASGDMSDNDYLRLQRKYGFSDESDADEEKSDPDATGRRSGIHVKKLSELSIAPERFQYKIEGVGKDGVTSQFAGIEYNPELAGMFYVWHDTNDGKDYVVNGHHRYALAQATGWDGEVAVQYIDRETEQEARAFGALVNIAQGQGTALDAAKFMRDMQKPGEEGLEFLNSNNVSVKGAVARDAVRLSNLSDQAFRELTYGRLEEKHARAIGTELKIGKGMGEEDRHAVWDVQNKLVGKIQKAKSSLSEAVVREMALNASLAPKVSKQGGGGLFGFTEEEEILFEDRAKVQAAVRQTLSKDVRGFNAVASSAREELLRDAGVGDVSSEAAARHRDESESILGTFEREVRLRGGVGDQINDILNQAAKEHNRVKGKEKGKVRRRAAAGVRAILASIGSSEGRPGAGVNGQGSGGDGKGGTSVPGEPHIRKCFDRVFLKAVAWDESAHPRDEDGQFDDKAGGETTDAKSVNVFQSAKEDRIREEFLAEYTPEVREMYDNLPDNMKTVRPPQVKSERYSPVAYQLFAINLHLDDNPKRIQQNFEHEYAHHFDRFGISNATTGEKVRETKAFVSSLEASREKLNGLNPVEVVRDEEERLRNVREKSGRSFSVKDRLRVENFSDLVNALTHGKSSLSNRGHSASYLSNYSDAEVFATGMVASAYGDPTARKMFPELMQYFEERRFDGGSWTDGSLDDDDIRKSFDSLFTKSASWDESEHPRDEDGQFDEKAGGAETIVGREVTIPQSHTYGEFEARIVDNGEGKADIIYRNSNSKGEDRRIGSIDIEHVDRWYDELSGVLRETPNSGNEHLDSVLRGEGQFLGRGQGGMVFGVGDKVVKASTVTPYHWNQGVRSPEIGNQNLRDEAQVVDELQKQGMPHLLPLEVVEHEGRVFAVRDMVDMDGFTQKHIDQAGKALEVMHAAKYIMRDRVQIGVDSAGDVAFFDVGEAGPFEPEHRWAKDDIHSDHSSLKRIAEDNGLEHVTPREKEVFPRYETGRGMAIDAIEKGEPKRAKVMLRRLDALFSSLRVGDPDMADWVTDTHKDLMDELNAIVTKKSCFDRVFLKAVAFDESKHKRDADGRFDDMPDIDSADQTDTGEFKEWFGDSKLVNADGSPQVVYHGTGADFEEFRVGGDMVSGAAYGTGVYVTRDARQAHRYAWQRTKGRGSHTGTGSIKPLFVRMENPLDLEGELTDDQIETISQSLSADTLEQDKSYHEAMPVRAVFSAAQKEKAHDLFDERLEHWEEHGDGYERYSPRATKSGDDFVVEYFDPNKVAVPKRGRDALDRLMRTWGSDYTLELAKIGIDGVITGDIIVVPDPLQIKSAIGNRGTFDPNDDDIRKSFDQLFLKAGLFGDDFEPRKKRGGKKPKFEGRGKERQGSLFDAGGDDLPGQSLLFNSDAAAGDDPTTMESIVASGEFDESEHPRDEAGRFDFKPTTDAEYAAMSRSRTQIHLETPIVGPSGAKLHYYDWKHQWVEEQRGDDVVEVRISDWDQAKESDDTGRLVVHQFGIEDRDGNSMTVSLESAMTELGYLDKTDSAAQFTTVANALKARALAQFEYENLPDDAPEHKRRKLNGRVTDLNEKIITLTRLATDPDNNADARRDYLRRAEASVAMYKTTPEGSRYNGAPNWRNLLGADYEDEGKRKDAYQPWKKLIGALNYDSQGSPRTKSAILYADGREETSSFGHKIPAVEPATDRRVKSWYSKKSEDVKVAVAEAEAWLKNNHKWQMTVDTFQPMLHRGKLAKELSDKTGEHVSESNARLYGYAKNNGYRIWNDLFIPIDADTASDEFQSGLVTKSVTWNEDKHRRDEVGRFDFKPGSQTDTPEFKDWFRNSHAVDENGNPKVLYHGTINDFHKYGDDEVQFRPSHSGANGLFGEMLYFTDSQDDANRYATTNLSDPTQQTNPDLVGKIDAHSELMGITYSEAKAELLDGTRPQVFPVYAQLERPMVIGHDEMKFDHKKMEQALIEIDMPREDAERLTRNFHNRAEKFPKNQKNWSVGERQWRLMERFQATQAYRQLATMDHTDGIVLHEDFTPLENSGTHYMVFRSSQVKSATGNSGAFSLDDDDIRKSFDRLFTKSGTFDESKHARDEDGRFDEKSSNLDTTNDAYLDFLLGNTDAPPEVEVQAPPKVDADEPKAPRRPAKVKKPRGKKPKRIRREDAVKESVLEEFSADEVNKWLVDRGGKLVPNGASQSGDMVGDRWFYAARRGELRWAEREREIGAFTLQHEKSKPEIKRNAGEIVVNTNSPELDDKFMRLDTINRKRRSRAIRNAEKRIANAEDSIQLFRSEMEATLRKLKDEGVRKSFDRLFTKAVAWDESKHPRDEDGRFGEKLTRLTVNGTGLLNNNVLDRMRLTDDEEMELVEEMDFGLQQPRDVPGDAVFYFTDEGLERHARMIELLEKAAKGTVDREVVRASKFEWQSGDGQVAIYPSDIIKDAPASQTDTPEFKAWFGDSKVVSEDGKPLVVYHGTKTGGFDSFQVPEGHGRLYFTVNPEYASGYTTDEFHAARATEAASVYPVYLQIDNPLDLDRFAKADPEFDGIGFSASSWARAGYDGAVSSEGGRTWMVFDSKQIKSAIGNRGTFDPNDDDIRKSFDLMFTKMRGMGTITGEAGGILVSPESRETCNVCGRRVTRGDKESECSNCGHKVPAEPFSGWFDRLMTKSVVFDEAKVRRDEDGQFDFKPESDLVEQTETEAFNAWFRDSQVVDDDGKPLTVYHGTRRPDRVGHEFDEERATSGPMAYFTDDPEIASNYAEDKMDTSMGGKNRDDASNVTINGHALGKEYEAELFHNAWHSLPAKERIRLREILPNAGYKDWDSDNEIDFSGEFAPSQSHFEWTMKHEHRGDAIATLYDQWTWGSADLDGALKVFTAAGIDFEFDDPRASQSAVFPVKLAIQNPLDTANVPSHVLDALENAAIDAPEAEPDGADMWDKDTRDPEDWVSRLREDTAEGNNSHVWTSIPDFVTEVLQENGYDGIRDTGGKLGGEGHTVWVPFYSEQVKSATGNQGTWDPNDPDIRKSFDQLFTKSAAFDESKHPRDEDGQFDFKPAAEKVDHSGKKERRQERQDRIKELEGKDRAVDEEDELLGLYHEDYEMLGARSMAFKRWFGDWEEDAGGASKAVNADGRPNKNAAFSQVMNNDNEPQVVYHGTTHEFEEFMDDRGNPENSMGIGHYFSTDSGDAGGNYAGEGPDLTQRMELRAEQMVDDVGSVLDDVVFDVEQLEVDGYINKEDGISEKESDLIHGIVSEHVGSIATSEPVKVEGMLHKKIISQLRDGDDIGFDWQDVSVEIARAELAGGEPQTIKAYLNVRNPVVFNGGDTRDGTVFEIEYQDDEAMLEETVDKMIDSVIEHAPDGQEDAVRKIGEEWRAKGKEANSPSELMSIMKDRDFDVEFGDKEDAAWEAIDEAVDMSDARSEYESWENDRYDYQEEAGNGVELIEAIRDAQYSYEYSDDLMVHVMDEMSGGGHITADEFYDIVGKKGEIMDPDTGGYVPGQFVADVFRRMGFDGMRDMRPQQRFPNMSIGGGAEHWIVWNSEQIKSTSNRGSFDPDDANVRKSLSLEEVPVFS